MTRYYFHVRDGKNYQEDPDGTECNSLEAAREEAVISAREILAVMVRNGELIDGHVFEITDEHGNIVDKVPFKSVLRIE